MKKEYDFSKAKHGPVVPLKAGKTRITIRLDTEILDWFRNKVHEAGGGNYQSLINETLRACIQKHDKDFEETLRRVIREELINCGMEEIDSSRNFEMTKEKLVAQVAEEAQISEINAERIINSLLGIISDTLKKDGRLALVGIGTFAVSEHKGKKVRRIQAVSHERPQKGKIIEFELGR